MKYSNIDILLLIILLIGVFFILKSFLKKNLKIYDDPMLLKIYDDLKKIYPEIESKHITIYGANNTLTENKKKIFLCIRKKNKEYYDYNTILYIAIHELAHVINEEYDINDNHGKKFNDINAQLLEKAYTLNLIDRNAEIKYDMCGTI